MKKRQVFCYFTIPQLNILHIRPGFFVNKEPLTHFLTHARRAKMMNNNQEMPFIHQLSQWLRSNLLHTRLFVPLLSMQLECWQAFVDGLLLIKFEAQYLRAELIIHLEFLMGNLCNLNNLLLRIV